MARQSVAVNRVAPTRRIARRPQHTFYLRHFPFVIQPFMIAPVLPGETLKSLKMQSRAVTDPVQNSITGWWLEYYFFYVKHRDLAGRADFTEMMLDLSKDMSAYNVADEAFTYHNGSAINWTKLCLVEITERYFRAEGEAWNVTGGTVTMNSETVPIAKVAPPGWMDSMIYTSALPDATVVNEGGVGTVTDQEIDVALRAYDLLRAQGLTDMTYEDYLRTFGVSVPKAEELHMPELLRYVREWSYPTNTIDPTTGTPSSALSWAVSEKGDKDRYFKEPGFIFGVTITRPKVYFRNQDGSAVQMMVGALPWLPSVMRDDPATSLVQVPEASGPLDAATTSAEYLVDVRDLLLYGDQFVNQAMTDPTAPAQLIGRIPSVDLPDANLNIQYVSLTDIQALFPLTDDDPVTYQSGYLRQDGVVNLEILGTQVDQTPSATGVRPGGSVLI